VNNIALSQAALDVLTTARPIEKAEKTREYVKVWREGLINAVGLEKLPTRPKRPEKPELRSPLDMPRRAKAGSQKSKIALLHALAHIELNAIDLAWDVIGRFAHYAEEHVKDPNGFSLPRAFYDDWCKVADDEAKHHLLLEGRLNDLDASYGDLPAHDGLWEASEKTAHDLAARLAIVPMVLEARGLDVTPNMIEVMKKQGDQDTVSILEVILEDEVTHVRAGTLWFEHWCRHHGHDIETYWQNLVRSYFNGKIKPPFNHPDREQAGLLRDWYEPLAEENTHATASHNT